MTNLKGHNWFQWFYLVCSPPAAPRVDINRNRLSTHSVEFLWMLGADGYSPITNVKVTCLDVVCGSTHSRVFDSVVGISGVDGSHSWFIVLMFYCGL